MTTLANQTDFNQSFTCYLEFKKFSETLKHITAKNTASKQIGLSQGNFKYQMLEKKYKLYMYVVREF